MPGMRNVWMLTLAQGFAACGLVVLVAFGTIVGTRIAPDPALSTLPMALAVVGMAIMTIPATLLMQCYGRKPVFIAGAFASCGAALLAAWATAHGHFGAFGLAATLMGASQAIALQYRFAAAEYVAPADVGRAVGRVMLGTLAAALAGPALAEQARHLQGWAEFTGSFLVLAALLAAGAFVLCALHAPPSHTAGASSAPRPLGAIVRQPRYLVAMYAGVCAYAVMSFIMTATPISMHVHDGIDVSLTRNVISAHLLAMFAPSLISGWLTRTLGMTRMMLLGVACMLACAAIAGFVGREFMHYLWALVLLGAGWNLLFVAGTTLLTSTYSPSERFRAQGFNDFVTFGVQAAVSLAAGAAVVAIGWERLNFAAVPMLIVMLGAIVWAARSANPVAPPSNAVAAPNAATEK
jgi:MFS family permease